MYHHSPRPPWFSTVCPSSTLASTAPTGKEIVVPVYSITAFMIGERVGFRSEETERQLQLMENSVSPCGEDHRHTMKVKLSPSPAFPLLTLTCAWKSNPGFLGVHRLLQLPPYLQGSSSVGDVIIRSPASKYDVTKRQLSLQVRKLMAHTEDHLKSSVLS